MAVGPLIGRGSETQVVARNVAAAGDGRGSITMLVGEAGIGKSRLAREGAGLARAAGLGVHWGRCWEAGGQVAYWPWIQIVRGIVRDTPTGELAARLGPLGRDVARLVPELAAACPDLPPLPDLDGAQSRFRLLEAVAGFLSASADEAPLVLVLDDLHAADRSSVELLDFVARRVDETPLAIVGTYRDTDARAAGLGELLSRVERGADVLRLARLGPDDIGAMVAAIRGQAPAPGEVERIVAASEGNPLFVEELVRRGDVTSVPDGIAAVIRERLALLPEATRAVLADASVAGRDLDVALLAAALDRPAAEVRAALETAAAQELLAGAVGDGDYRFAHILVREVLYRDLPPPRRLAVHGALGRAIAARPAPSGRSLAAQAHHFDQAGPDAAAEAIAAYRQAAATATAQLAFAEAAELLGRALDIQATSAPDDDRLRLEMLLARGEALMKAGAAELGQRSCAEAAELARRLDSSELLARAALGLGSVFSFGLTDGRLVDLLREALAALPPDELRLRALCEARLAAALQPAKDARIPIAMAHEAIALARTTGDDRTLLATIRSASSALMDFEHPRKRAVINREHLELARRLGDSAEILRGCARLVVDYCEAGDVFSADAMVETYATEAARVSHPFYGWQAAGLRVMRLVMRGELDQAEVAHARAAALAPDTGDAYSVGYSVMQAMGLARARYDDERLRPMLAHPMIVAGMAQLGDAGKLLMGAFLAHLEDEAELRRLIGDGVVESAVASLDPHVLTGAAEIAFALGDAALAGAVAPRLATMIDRNTSWGLICMICDTPIDRSLALCAAARGDLAGARRHFDDAARRTADMAAPAMRARIQYEHAVAIDRLGGDAAASGALLAEAEAIARERGMAGLVRRIAARRPGAPVELAPPAPVAAVRVDRDGDGWVVRFRGDPIRVRDSRGMQILARLVTEPGREVHVLELATRAPVVDTGDSGVALDAEAIDAYRRRARELREELEEAEAWNDAGRADRARAELEVLSAELSRGVGLGGRARRDQSAAERARVNVRKRIQHALRALDACSPELARYLQRTIRTGAFCSFEPV